MLLKYPDVNVKFQISIVASLGNNLKIYNKNGDDINNIPEIINLKLLLTS
jgi:hypothetical protein